MSNDTDAEFIEKVQPIQNGYFWICFIFDVLEISVISAAIFYVLIKQCR